MNRSLMIKKANSESKKNDNSSKEDEKCMIY